MADTILVIAEQREGKLNRVSLETITARRPLPPKPAERLKARSLAAASPKLPRNSPLKSSPKSSTRVPKLAKYTPDGLVAALKDFIDQKQPKLVLMPHTYQVRDFAPQLATALERTLISDAIGFKYEGGKLLFTRQMFQGKFAADVSFAVPRAVFRYLPERRIPWRQG